MLLCEGRELEQVLDPFVFYQNIRRNNLYAVRDLIFSTIRYDVDMSFKALAFFDSAGIKRKGNRIPSAYKCMTLEIEQVSAVIYHQFDRYIIL